MNIVRIRDYKAGNTKGFVYSINGQRAASFAKSWDHLVASIHASMGFELGVDEKLKILDYDRDLYTVKYWSKYGHDRVYITLLEKLNGGKNWNGGIGGAWYVDLKDGHSRQAYDWAGAATRKAYTDDVNCMIDKVYETCKLS